MEELIPKETETIAALRARRLAEKLKKASQIGIVKAWWNNRLVETLSLTIIFSLNFYVVFPLFGTYSNDAFFSGPVVPILSKSIEVLGEFPFSYAVQIVNIVLFLAFPLSLYLFIRKVSDRKLIGILAAVIVSLPLYPFAETRIYASIMGVDAAHIASLSVVPLALIGILSFIRSGGIRNLILAALLSSLVALISPFGFFTFGIFAGIITFSEMLLGGGRLKVFRLMMVLIVSGGLVSFWYNPSFFFWMITGPMGENLRSTTYKMIPMAFFTIPPLAAFGYLLFDRKPTLQPVFIASFLSIFYTLISLAGGGFFPSHPSRYAPELGISLSLLLSILIVKTFDFMRTSSLNLFSKINKKVLSSAFLILVFVLLTTSIVVQGKKFESSQNNILGIWDDVEKGEIWEAKEKFSGGHSIWGYSVTTITLAGLFVLRQKSRKELIT